MLPNQSTQSPEPTSPARRRRRLDGRLIGLTDQNRQPGKSQNCRKTSKGFVRQRLAWTLSLIHI